MTGAKVILDPHVVELARAIIRAHDTPAGVRAAVRKFLRDYGVEESDQRGPE